MLSKRDLDPDLLLLRDLDLDLDFDLDQDLDLDLDLELYFDLIGDLDDSGDNFLDDLSLRDKFISGDRLYLPLLCLS